MAAANRPRAAGRLSRGRLDPAFVVLAAVSFVVSLGVFVVAPLLPLFAVSLAASPLQLGLLTGGFAVASAAGQLGVGLFVDRAGSRAFVRGGLAVYGAGCGLVAAAADAWTLILFRSVSGVGQGANSVAARLYLAQTAGRDRLAFANGALFAAQSAGSVAGPAVGGLLAEWLGPRAPFAFVAAASAVGLLAASRLPRPGATTAVEPPGRDGPQVAVLNPAVRLLLAAQVCYMAWHGVTTTVFPLVATQLLRWTPAELGGIFSVYALGSILLGPWLSHAADRFGRAPTAVLCCVPLVVWTVAIALSAPGWIVVATTLATGGSNAAALAAQMALLTEATVETTRGRAFGVVSAAGQLGLAGGALFGAGVWQVMDLPTALLAGNFGLVLVAGLLIWLARRAPAHAGVTV